MLYFLPHQLYLGIQAKKILLLSLWLDMEEAISLEVEIQMLLINAPTVEELTIS